MSCGLSECELKLWLYLDKNQDGYQFALSQKDCAEWGIAKTSYYKAVKGLIQRGFLVPKNEKETIFEFRERTNTGKSQEESLVSEQDNSICENSCSNLELNSPQTNREILHTTNKTTKDTTVSVEPQSLEEYESLWYPNRRS